MLPLRDELPSQSRPLITIALIAANVAVFLYQFSLGSAGNRQLVYSLGAVPALITGQGRLETLAHAPIPASLTIITSMFLHGGLWHLAGNMLFLWIFGDNVEDVMGRGRFLIFYLLSGVIAALGHILLEPSSSVPMVGASGAISGVLGAYLILFPRSKIITLVFFFYFIQLVHIPALFFLGIWIIFQSLYGIASLGTEGAGVAWFAHIGGFLAGVILVFFFRRKDRWAWYRRFV